MQSLSRCVGSTLSRSSCSGLRSGRTTVPRLRPNSCFNKGQLRLIAHSSSNSATPPSTPDAPNVPPFLQRLLDPEPSEQTRNPLLAALGYYSKTSQTIAAGNSLYEGSLKKTQWEDAMPPDEILTGDPEDLAAQWAVFSTRFQVLSIHLWMTLVKLRQEGSDGAEVAQCMFNKFWEEMPKKMIDEEGLRYLEMRKWVVECEKVFFGMGTAFDAALASDEGRADKMKAAIAKNLTFTRQEPQRVARVMAYIEKNLERLDSLGTSELWSGSYWVSRGKVKA